jgi:hypothetical protein
MIARRLFRVLPIAALLAVFASAAAGAPQSIASFISVDGGRSWERIVSYGLIPSARGPSGRAGGRVHPSTVYVTRTSERGAARFRVAQRVVSLQILSRRGRVPYLKIVLKNAVVLSVRKLRSVERVEFAYTSITTDRNQQSAGRL